MCDPLSIVGGVMGVGGMLANQKGAAAQAQKRNRVAAAERARQAGLEAQSQAEFARVLPKAGTDATRQRVAEAQAVRTAEGEDAITDTPDPGMPVTGSAPKVVTDSYSRAMAAALRRGLERARAQAAVGAYGDAGADLNVDLARSGQTQAQIGSASQRSAQIFPMEMEAANQAGAGWRTIGSLLGVGGQVAGAAGASGIGPSWGSIFGYPKAIGSRTLSSPMGGPPGGW